MEVRLNAFYKFVMWLVGICTLGIGALIMWVMLRRWPKYIDNEGVTLRNGRRFLWSEVDDTKWVTLANYRGNRIGGRLDLVCGTCRIPIVPQSLVNGEQVIDYIGERLGMAVRQPQ